MLASLTHKGETSGVWARFVSFSLLITVSADPRGPKLAFVRHQAEGAQEKVGAKR